jgi:transcriptional regulatory protein RtcR
VPKASLPKDERDKRPLVVIGLLGTTLDAGRHASRWSHWRPTISFFQHDDLHISRLELLVPPRGRELAETVVRDVRALSPTTEVRTWPFEPGDPWDFEAVYAALDTFARDYPFKPDDERYWIHITTGTHVAQICLFLLTESGFLPGVLAQTTPPHGDRPGPVDTIDLDLARYDRLAARFADARKAAEGVLKSGIATRNPAFNTLIGRIEHVALASTAPILLEGPTGAGKSQLARRIFELKHSRRQLKGPLVEVNCATLRGDQAMSTLFGHTKGAFTGANADRKGLLLAADGGLLFLDEIGELGLDEQAMLLRAIEEKRFLPLGADRESRSEFQLIAGTNRSLVDRVGNGQFRDDLLARIDLWTFRLPPLAERREDIEPNVDYELERFAEREGKQVRFNREARARFLAWATGPSAAWPGNFRDLNAAIVRLATLADGGRITTALVDEEILRHHRGSNPTPPTSRVEALFGADGAADLDRFERVQLDDVLAVCATSRTMSEAGRVLFAASRAKKTSSNDADRLRKYLGRFGLEWKDTR